MADSFGICRNCGSDVCYEVDHGNSIHWSCLDCGFYTNTFMLKDSDVVEQIVATSPELYKDLMHVDADGLVWAPKVISAETGLVFVDGTSVDNWGWAFVPNVPIPKAEQYRYPVKGKPGEFHQVRADHNLKKTYGQLDFILALQDTGMLLKQLV